MTPLPGAASGVTFVHEFEYVRALAMAFRRLGWDVLVGPAFGSLRPDLVVTMPRSALRVVIEVKSDRAPVHVAAVAQAASQVAAAEQAMRRPATGALVLASPWGPGLRDAAERLGVHLVERGDPSDVAAAVARSARLWRRDRASRRFDA
jgi:hypothetical protein